MNQQLLLPMCLLLAVGLGLMDAFKLHRSAKYTGGFSKAAKIHKKTTSNEGCSGYWVKCPTSDKCIRPRWFCDGDNDCGDYSDEAEPCPPVNCSSGETKCLTKNRCVANSFICNGRDDCGDNSDEPEDCASRECPVGFLKCNSGQCIELERFCSGATTCEDNTRFTDFRCPHITCDSGYVKCPHLSKCIRSVYVCDGDNDCGDNSDEPENCRDRLCNIGEFNCNNGQCINTTAFCMGIDTYGCRDDTDRSGMCSNFECPEGMTKCVSDGNCIRNSQLCDGSADCGDNSDEASHHCATPVVCDDPEKVQCPGVRRCINKRYFCDNDNDCGDYSDEEESFCSSRTCESDEVRCDNGQCLPKDSFCARAFSCRDGSLDVNSDICPSRGDHSNQTDQSQLPGGLATGPGEMECFMSIQQSERTCVRLLENIMPRHTNPYAVYHMLVEKEMSELCGYVTPYFECMKDATTPCENVNHPMWTEIEQTIFVAETLLNYVCVQDIDVFNRNKACLLREAEGEQLHSSEPELMLQAPLMRSCMRLIQPAMMRGSIPCFSRELQACAIDVVEAQCGDEIASAIDGLADRVYAALDCESIPVTHAKRRRIPFNRGFLKLKFF